MIELRLYDLDDTIGLLETLYKNDYVSSDFQDYESIKKDVIRQVGTKQTSKKYYILYFIKINPVNETFSVFTKCADINYLRSEKLKQLNLR